MVFRGYIDESYGPKQNVFTLSCLLATGKDWREMERKWKLHLRAKNKELKKAGRRTISRYHASDCSGCRGEFEDWTRDERDAFVLGLFGIFKQIPLHTDVFDVQLDDVCEVFPEWKDDRLETAYRILIPFLLVMIGQDFYANGKHNTPAKITLFHDRTAGDGKYDPTILRAFNKHITDPTFRHRDYFTTIAALSWERCLALQPADLVAFECFKVAEARLEARTFRKSFKALLDMEAFGIHSKTINKTALQKFRGLIESKNTV